MRWLCLAILAIPLAGCALPPAVTIASLALDAGSYVVSGKTMTDHGLSIVAQKDCRLIGVLQGQVCEERPEYDTTVVATLQPLPGDGERRIAGQTRERGTPSRRVQLSYLGDGLEGLTSVAKAARPTLALAFISDGVQAATPDPLNAAGYLTAGPVPALRLVASNASGLRGG